jgi:hypothetical protein
VFLQAYLDDSGGFHESVDPVFVLAGFVAESAAWEAFSDEWQTLLDKSPGLDYFKMSEAARLRGQFDKSRGWTEALVAERLSELINVVRRYALFGVCVSVDKKAFFNIVRRAYLPRRTFNTDLPYCIAFQRVLIKMPGVQKLRPDIFGPTPRPIKFVFDEQGEIGLEAQRTWLNIKRHFERLAQWHRIDFRPYLGSMPSFKDDNQVKPLQAADLLAWQARRVLCEKAIPPNRLIDSLGEMPGFVEHIGRDDLNSVMLGAQVLSAGTRGQLLMPYLGSKLEQKRNRVMRRALAKQERKKK